MTINATDIKLLESERMSDAANGGGRKTSRVIVDGEPGNIFPKVSRLDSVYGRVNLRKVYGAVVTENLDTYAGAHAVVMDPPDNAQIHVNLFSTASDYDTRTAARDRIESYVVAGPESRMIVYGRQLVGQQAVLVYQRVEEPLPEVGEVYCLSKETSTVIAYQQFVRVTDMSHEVRTFTDGSGDFQRRVVNLEIGAPLRYEFRGPETPSRVSSVTRESLMRNTTVADASRYYGIQKLAEVGAEDALDLRVQSVYSPIVPTTQRESAISLASISGAGGFINSGEASFGYSTFYSTFTGTHYFPTGVKPGTVKVFRQGVLMSGDDGAGQIVETAAGTATSQNYAGTIDYETGAVTGLGGFSSDFITFEAKPAVSVSQPARTREIEITLATRGTVYSEVLNPLPNPGSVIVDYRALGKWYRLRDNGTGELSGNDPAYGVGTVDYVTGGLVVTLGALPDVESSVLISWGSQIDYAVRAGATQDVTANTFDQTFTLTNVPIEPASLTLTFVSNGTTYTATANSSGAISGNGVTGSVIHETGVVAIRYSTRKPDVGSIVTAAYNELVADDPAEPSAITAEQVDFVEDVASTLEFAPVRVSSFVMTINATADTIYGTIGGFVRVYDDGFGQLKTHGSVPFTYLNGVTAYPIRVVSGTVVGSINYTTGEVTITTRDFQVVVPKYVVPNDITAAGWVDETATATMRDDLPGSANYTCTSNSTTQTARTDSISTVTHPIFIDLTRTTSEPIVPGSVLFTLTGSSTAQFFDRNGVLYTALNSATGSATVAGSVDYMEGRAYLTNGHNVGMLGSTPVSISVKTCVTQIGDFTAVEAFFRTAGSPLRPASLYVQASAIDGTLLSGTADTNGEITGTKIRGTVVQDMGVVRVEFGEMVGGDWVPTEVFPTTLRYSAVVLSNLPLNADILGLDPVRLPSDGRVPIYRPADVVVIHHTDDLTLTNPVSAGATYSVGRANLSQLWLLDANGLKVPTTKYAANLAAGSVTMAADLDLTGYVQPLVAKHRIEEMQLLSDVQINGTLGLTAPLTREFPVGSYVSGALLFGDMNASVPALFDQVSWTSVWSDEQIGSGATAQYNDIDYPIEVLNDGAVTDRWRINFTSSTAFQVISENLGVITTGTTASDCSPTNLLTGKPYFVIRASGWGLGWATGNQLRFNTSAASRPIWIARTVLPGATLNGDSFDLQVRGDVDA